MAMSSNSEYFPTLIMVKSSYGPEVPQESPNDIAPRVAGDLGTLKAQTQHFQEALKAGRTLLDNDSSLQDALTASTRKNLTGLSQRFQAEHPELVQAPEGYRVA